MTHPLEKHLWKDRVLLIFSSQQSFQQEQLKHWQTNSTGMKERDLVIYLIDDSEVSGPKGNTLDHSAHQYFLEKFNWYNDQNMVVLIGKDGAKKYSTSKIFKTESLFSIIDGMPMRKREMKDDFR